MRYDKSKVFVALESKVFGIGLEAYTVGSSEFGLLFAKERGLVPLLETYSNMIISAQI
jgi:L-rhamnose isomerase